MTEGRMKRGGPSVTVGGDSVGVEAYRKGTFHVRGRSGHFQRGGAGLARRELVCSELRNRFCHIRLRGPKACGKLTCGEKAVELRIPWGMKRRHQGVGFDWIAKPEGESHRDGR